MVRYLGGQNICIKTHFINPFFKNNLALLNKKGMGRVGFKITVP